MAHKKAGASTASQKGNRQGKHRGLKVGDGEKVICGRILVRQLGSVVLPGENVGMGRDYTLFAKKDGQVKFKSVSKNKKSVSII